MRRTIRSSFLVLFLFLPLLVHPLTLSQAERSYRELIYSKKRFYRHNWERVISLYKRLLKEGADREKVYYRLYCLYKGLYSYSGRISDRDRARYYLRKYREEKRRNTPVVLKDGFLQLTGNSLVIKLPRRVDVRYFFLEKPKRVVFDLKPAKVLQGRRFRAKAPFRVVRCAQYRPKVVRVVAELSREDVLVVRKGGSIVLKPKVRKIYLYSSGVRVVVIDPGHGGRDPGAIGPTGLKEKDVVLDVAKRLKRLIEEKTDLKVYLTRTKDFYVPLDERIRFARRMGADLFISIHINANRNRRLSGVETYYLDPRIDVVRRRYRSLKGLNFILSDLVVTSNLKTSKELAEEIQKGICKRTLLRSNGIKRAPFYVLLFNDIPSILVEAGYISNPREERLLKRSWFRQRLAEGIFEGLKSYLLKRVRVLEARK